MSISRSKSIILEERVDLDELESLLRYLALGFTFFSKFSVIANNSNAAIPKSEANTLKQKFDKTFSGKSKSYLRARIPILLIGIVQFSDSRAQGAPLSDRAAQFENLIKDVDSGTLSRNEFDTLIQTAQNGLNRPYYTSKLNQTLDPLSSFFDGQTPNSFSNALLDTVALLQSKKPNDTPVLREVGDTPERTITIVEGDGSPPQIRLIEDDIPPVDTVTPPKDTKEDSSKSVEPPQSPSLGIPLLYAGAGVMLGTLIGFIARKARRSS